MKKLILFALLLAFPKFAEADVLEPMTCNQAGVAAYVAMMGQDGDTVKLPACAPTNWDTTWTSPFGVMVEGDSPCTMTTSALYTFPRGVGDNVEISYPASCSTNIVDAVVGIDNLIVIPVPACTHPCAYQPGMRDISFTTTGARTWASYGIFSFPRVSPILDDGRRVVIERIRIVGFNAVGGTVIFRISTDGVASNLWIQSDASYAFQMAEGGSTLSASANNTTLSDSSIFGREDAFTIQESVVQRMTANVSRLTDSQAGANRVVVRRNYLHGHLIDSHGTEGGWYRGPHYHEVYQNRICPGTPGVESSINEIRTGSVMSWGNVTCSGFQTGTPPAAHLKNYRLRGQFASFGEVDGHNPIDENGSTYATCTTTAASEGDADNLPSATVTVAGCTGDNSWTTNELQRKIIHQTNCSVAAIVSCAAAIDSNTTGGVIRFIRHIWNDFNDPEQSTLTLAPGGGDTVHIHELTSAFDSPCHSSGAVLGAIGAVTSLTISGATATLTSPQSMLSLGLANGDYVAIEAKYAYTQANSPVGCGTVNPGYCDHPYTGVYQVSGIGANPDFSFTYTPNRTPTGNASPGVDTAFAKIINGGSANQTGGCWEFLNFNSANNAIHFETALPTGVSNSRTPGLPVSGLDSDPAMVFNWVGTSTVSGVQTAKGVPFTGAVGTGVGTFLRRPDNCTPGVLYWATDEGEWDSTNGATPDGNGYKCTATDTWTLFYTPLNASHPLISDAGFITSITPDEGVQGASLNNVAFVGSGFDCAGFSVPTFSGLTITDVVVTDANNMRWDIAIAADASVGNRSIYFNCTAGPSISATFTVNASADTTAPTPGGGGTITPTVLSSSSIRADWTKATDNVSAAGTLQYECRRSSSNNMGNVANAEANGAIFQAYTTDIASCTADSLSPDTEYWFVVIVKDEAGNKQVYTQINATTDEEPGSPPVPGATGVLAALNVTPTGFTILFFAGTDNDTPQNSLEYSIRRSLAGNISTVADAETYGVLILNYTPIAPIDGAIALPIGLLSPNTTYYWQVIVRDGEGEKVAYTMMMMTTSVQPVTGGTSGRPLINLPIR